MKNLWNRIERPLIVIAAVACSFVLTLCLDEALAGPYLNHDVVTMVVVSKSYPTGDGPCSLGCEYDGKVYYRHVDRWIWERTDPGAMVDVRISRTPIFFRLWRVGDIQYVRMTR
jgi:hypothetical protein